MKVQQRVVTYHDIDLDEETVTEIAIKKLLSLGPSNDWYIDGKVVMVFEYTHPHNGDDHYRNIGPATDDIRAVWRSIEILRSGHEPKHTK